MDAVRATQLLPHLDPELDNAFRRSRFCGKIVSAIDASNSLTSQDTSLPLDTTGLIPGSISNRSSQIRNDSEVLPKLTFHDPANMPLPPARMQGKNETHYDEAACSVGHDRADTADTSKQDACNNIDHANVAAPLSVQITGQQADNAQPAIDNKKSGLLLLILRPILLMNFRHWMQS